MGVEAVAKMKTKIFETSAQYFQDPQDLLQYCVTVFKLCGLPTSDTTLKQDESKIIPEGYFD